MIENLSLNFVVVMSLLGWGVCLSKIFNLSSGTASEFFLNGILSIVPLSLIALSLNFFIPLSETVSAVVLFFGLAFCWPLFVTVSWSKKFLVWIVVISFLIVGQTVDNNLVGDSLLYHIPTLLWIKSETLVVGLVNLHDRFGFNSLWHLFLALIMPAMKASTYTDSGLSSLMILFAGFLISRGLEANQNHKRHWLFYAALFFVYFVVWGKESQFHSLGSSGTDVPATILAIVAFVLCLEQWQQKSEPTVIAALWLLCYSVMLKLSQIYLILAVAFLLHSLREKVWQKKDVLYSAGLIFVLGFVWILRTWLLSGCLIFPSLATCTGAEWTLPVAEIQELMGWIKAWPRSPGEAPAEVLANWNWLGPWWSRLWHNWPLKISVFLVIGSVLAGRLRQQWQKERDRKFLVFIGVSFVIWFLLAPDLRFITAVIIFSVAWLLTFLLDSFEKQYQRAFKVLALLIILLVIQDQSRITASAIKYYPWVRMRDYSEWGEPLPKVSRHGVPYLQAQKDFYCGFFPLPCVPFNKNRLKESWWGPFKMYSTE